MFRMIVHWDKNGIWFDSFYNQSKYIDVCREDKDDDEEISRIRRLAEFDVDPEKDHKQRKVKSTQIFVCRKEMLHAGNFYPFFDFTVVLVSKLKNRQVWIYSLFKSCNIEGCGWKECHQKVWFHLFFLNYRSKVSFHKWDQIIITYIEHIVKIWNESL